MASKTRVIIKLDFICSELVKLANIIYNILLNLIGMSNK
jgi:hypothetical protein